MITLIALAGLIAQPDATAQKAPTVCKAVQTQQDTGSRLRRDAHKKLCLTQAEWARFARDPEPFLDRVEDDR